jgi:hypothetical protein
VKEAVPVEDYAATVTALKRAGGSCLRGPCPVHQGTNPQSFAIYTKESRWWCYRCSMGGDVIDLCELVERHADTWTAMISLSQQFGVELPQRPPRWHAWQDEKGKQRKMIRKALADSYQRRFFRVFGGHLADIEDPGEYELEAERFFAALRSLAVAAAKNRMVGR